MLRVYGVHYQELRQNYTINFTLLILRVTSAKLTHSRTLLTTIFVIKCKSLTIVIANQLPGIGLI